MPNHYHLQVELGSGLSLSAAMHWLNTWLWDLLQPALPTARSVVSGTIQSDPYWRALDERITHEQLGLDWKGELAAGVLMGSGTVEAFAGKAIE
jgi:hypothetical protein